MSTPSSHILTEAFLQSDTPIAILTGEDYKIEFANPAYERLVAKSVMGKPLRELFSPEEVGAFTTLMDQSVTSGERSIGTELSLVTSDAQGKREERFLNVTYQPFRDEHQKLIGVLAIHQDVTKLVRSREHAESAKDEIQTERENFRNLFRQTPEMVCILSGPEHVFEFVNEAHVRALGFDATGMSVREAQPESVEVHGLLDSVYKTGVTECLHEIPVTLGDRLRYFDLTYAARKDSEGNIDGVMILGIEISSAYRIREGAKLQLQALTDAVNNEALEKILRKLVDMVEYQTASEVIGSVLLASPNKRQLFNGAAPRLPDEYNQIIHGIEIGDDVGSCGTAAFRKKPVIVTDIQNDPRWRNYRDVASKFNLRACWSYPILSSANELLGTFAFYSHVPRIPSESELQILEVAVQTCSLIMERRASIVAMNRSVKALEDKEDELQFALRSTKMSTWKVNLQTMESSFAEGITELLGNPVGEMKMDLSIEQIVHPDDREAVRKNFVESLAENKEHHEEVRLLRADGSICWALSRGRIRRGVNGKPDIMAGIIIDITDRKIAEERMRESKVQADRANELKSAFLANMSHEIRTPLGAMIGFADLLREPGLSSAERSNYIDILSRNGESLSVIINDILDLSKVESGHLRLEYTDTYPEEITEDVLSLLRVKAKEKNLPLIYSRDESTPRVIVSDPHRFRQILLNLVGNAIKFTNFGSVTVKTYGCESANKRPSVCIEIIDTGIGIPENQTEKVFEMFVQADGSTTRRFGGTGLGLALSRSLARSLGGEVQITKTSPGKGTTFLIVIEDKPERRTSEDSGRKEKKPELDLSKKWLEGVKVLVVDDSPDNQELIWHYLSKQGALIETADNGVMGVRLAMSGAYDIVLMDIQMPEMDGYTAIHKLRAAGYGRPIVALTAHAMNEVREKVLRVGGTAHLAKPIDFRSLIELVDQLVH